MIMQINVPEYFDEEGIEVPFTEGARVEGFIADDLESIGIKANAQGLVSLAIHLLELSQNKVPFGSHIHYDNLTLKKEVTEKSIEFIIEKME